MRVLVSTLAVIANVAVLLLILIAILGQTVMAHGHEPIPTSAIVVETALIVLSVLNTLAILAGARAFKPRTPTADVVSTFN
jgi:hypothetical protein